MSHKTVCSTTHVFHDLVTPQPKDLDSFWEKGIRPLSDFPASERWQQLNEHLPGFYKNLYGMMAAAVLEKPYTNSGIFVTPIDFYLLPGTFLHDKPRFSIPVERIEPEWTVLSYVIRDERVSLPFTPVNLENIAALWDADMVTRWFAVDQTKVFFYVPQAAAYQGRIDVSQRDLELR